MPTRAPRPCRHHSCRVLVRTGNYCELHAQRRNRNITESRAESTRFYTSRRWRAFRAAVLRSQPLCVECEKAGRIAAATDVDHIVPRRERPDLAFDIDNVQGLCRPCHSIKTRQGR